MHFCVYTGLISRGNTLLLKTLVSHLQDVDALLWLTKTVSLQVVVYSIAVVEDVCQLVDASGVAAVLRDAEHLCT